MIHKVEFYGTIIRDTLTNHSYDFYPFKGDDPYIGFLSFDADISCEEDWSGTCKLHLLVGNFNLLDLMQPWSLTVGHTGDKTTYSTNNGALGLSVIITLDASGSIFTINAHADPSRPDLDAHGSGKGGHFIGSKCPAV
jgi:hypothetical protein